MSTPLNSAHGFDHAQRAAAQEAVGACREALALQPGSSDLWDGLGSALRQCGEFNAAEEAFRQAVRLDPRSVAAHDDLAGLLYQQGRLPEALAEFQAVAGLRPELAGAQFNLGACFQAQELFVEALAAYRRTIKLDPAFAFAHRRLGEILYIQKDFAAALASYRHWVRLEPDNAESVVALGTVWQVLGNISEAKTSYRRALELKPGDISAHFNLGTVAREEGRDTDSEAHFGAVLEQVPDQVAALHGLATLRHTRGDLPSARQIYDRILRVQPDDAAAHYFRGNILLSQGDWLSGWPELEYRFAAEQSVRRTFSQPRWDGTAVGNRTLLVHAEFALGDTLQLIRYIPIIKNGNPSARVRVELYPKLIPLVAQSGFADLVAHGGELEGFDLYIPLMSLPGVVATTVETVPANIPYLFANEQLVGAWRKRLKNLAGFRIGINWQGNPAYGNDRTRSIPLSRFEPLAAVRGVTLISLQKEAGCEQIGEVSNRFHVVELAGLDETAGAFMDTAAVMTSLDLVITSDSAVAHLAGGLGVPVWLAISTTCDWRWLVEGTTSPWYPGMRLFRQTAPGDWPGVFARMAGELERLVERCQPHAAS